MLLCGDFDVLWELCVNMQEEPQLPMQTVLNILDIYVVKNKCIYIYTYCIYYLYYHDVYSHIISMAHAQTEKGGTKKMTFQFYRQFILSRPDQRETEGER